MSYSCIYSPWCSSRNILVSFATEQAMAVAKNHQRWPKWWCFSLLQFILMLSAMGQTMAQLPGSWEILVEDAGIASMHSAVTHFGNVVLLDRTDIGATRINLSDGRCRNDPTEKVLKHDCHAHSVLYTPGSNNIRPLTILTDTWCSSGQFLPDGTLLHTGGDFDGNRRIRKFVPCASDGVCDWEELTDKQTAVGRWYSTNQLLPDGRVIVVGGRGQYDLEYVPPSQTGVIALPFLKEVADEQMDNLYPYVHLIPDGNLFIFANQDAILYNYKGNKVVRTYPTLPGNPRNYPSAGSSAMLALTADDGFSTAEIVVCGGAAAGAFQRADYQQPANGNCGRITATDEGAKWEVEDMPFMRIMGDMVMLPTGDVLLINGAQAGTQGFNLARNPCLYPVLYEPGAAPGQRFTTLTPTEIPRMYHSTANLLPDGRILLAGSNTHYYYTFEGQFPTELRLEAFSPGYLSPALSLLRPKMVAAPKKLKHGERFEVQFEVPVPLVGMVELNMASAPFVTHSFAQGQRLIKLSVQGPQAQARSYLLSALAPPNPIIAPPSYYMLFLVNEGVPSHALWVQLV